MNNLKKIREEKGLSQVQVAKDLNLVRSTICQYEKGNRDLGVTMLIKLSDYFNVSIDYLVGKTETKANTEQYIDYPQINIEQWKIAKKEKNLSYDDIARITGYSRSTITNIFCGYIEFPRYETIQAIEKALGINKQYTEQEKRLINAYRTLTPNVQDNLLNLVESMSTNVKGKGNYA